MTIKTDVSKLDDAELGVLQHHYATVMSDTDLLMRYAAMKKDLWETGLSGISLAKMYVSCKEAIIELGVEREKRKAPQTVKRREMP